MRNKRAMLLTEEVLKMIVAVIGLVLLAYFLVSFFSSDAREQKQKEAVSIIERISEVISNLQISGENVTALQPQGWTLFSFIEAEKKPNQCAEENCMCICKKVVADVFDNQIKKCSKQGACLIVPNLKEFEDIKIEKTKEALTSINIKKVNNQIEITQKWN